MTSGTFSPSLKKNIGLAYIPKNYNQENIKVKKQVNMINQSINDLINFLEQTNEELTQEKLDVLTTYLALKKLVNIK